MRIEGDIITINMSTSLRQLTNRIEDLYIDSPHSTPDVPTPPSRRIKSMGTPHSPPSSPIPSSSRTPATPTPAANTTSSATLTSPLLRLSTNFQTEVAVKERDTSNDDETITYHTPSSFTNSIRISRASSYNPKQWRTSSSFRAEGIDQLTHPIEDHLYQRGYVNGVCSDISINAFDKSYSLHRIILDRSPFFSSLFAGPWRDSDIPVLSLDFSDPNITQPAFDIALQRLYGHTITPDEDIVASLLAAGAYLDLQDLVEECLATLLRTLNPDNVSKRYAFSRGKQYYGEASEKLAEACYTLLCHAGSSMSLDQWDGIPNEVAAEVISSDAFWVEGEYERYCFTRDFIKRRKSQGSEDIQVLEQVLITGIHYLHLPFETLQQILADKEDGKSIVPPGIIHHALWQQTTLRQIIVSADPMNPSLNLEADDGWTVPSKDTMTDPFNAEEDTEIVAVIPEKMGSDLTSPIQETEEIITTASPYPPFRFSVEFRGIRALTEGEKSYSRTVFYAGSHWRVFTLLKLTNNSCMFKRNVVSVHIWVSIFNVGIIKSYLIFREKLQSIDSSAHSTVTISSLQQPLVSNMNQRFYTTQPFVEVENLFINIVKVVLNQKTNVNVPPSQSTVSDTSTNDQKFSHISNFGVLLEVPLVVV